jgi:hypothetical protein
MRIAQAGNEDISDVLIGHDDPLHLLMIINLSGRPWVPLPGTPAPSASAGQQDQKQLITGYRGRPNSGTGRPTSR